MSENDQKILKKVIDNALIKTFSEGENGYKLLFYQKKRCKECTAVSKM